MVGSSSTSPFAAPRRGRLSNPLGLSLSLGVTPGPANELGCKKASLVRAQPLMEIVTMPSGQDSCESPQSKGSRVGGAQHPTASRLPLGGTGNEQDGLTLRRAHIVLKGQSSPIGWITIWSKDGTHPVVRSVYARLSTKWFRHLLFASNLRPAQKRSACFLWAQSFRWWSRDETLKVINVFA